MNPAKMIDLVARAMLAVATNGPAMGGSDPAAQATAFTGFPTALATQLSGTPNLTTAIAGSTLTVTGGGYSLQITV